MHKDREGEEVFSIGEKEGLVPSLIYIQIG
jgi:hypothetical protein